MNIKVLALAGLLSLGATGAFADSFSATLASPVAKPVKFIAANALWTCEGSTCTTAVGTEDTLSASGCRDLTKTVGAVTTYSGAASLSASELARCNAGRAGVAATTTVAAAH